MGLPAEQSWGFRVQFGSYEAYELPNFTNSRERFLRVELLCAVIFVGEIPFV